MFGFIKKLFGATPVEKKVEECPVMAAPYKVEAAPTPVVEAAPAKKAPAKKAPAKKPAVKAAPAKKPAAPRKPKASPAK